MFIIAALEKTVIMMLTDGRIMISTDGNSIEMSYLAFAFNAVVPFSKE